MNPKQVSISIVIPAYNEEATIETLVGQVLNELSSIKSDKDVKIYSEILVIDDGSQDRTLNVLKKINTEKKITLITHKYNQGKGSALNSGFSKAKGDIVIIQDADLEYHPKYYRRLLRPILKGSAEVVYGTRLRKLPLNFTTLKSIPLPLHFIANKFLSLLTSLLYGQTITDMETGYKVFKREVLKDLVIESKGFEIEVELTSKILVAQRKLVEVDITTQPRHYHEGKKITFVDGLKAVYYLCKYRLILRP